MAKPEPLPAAFDADLETYAFLTREKKKAAKNFKLTKAASLQNGMQLAWWLYVFGCEAQAVEVCRILAQYEFQGNFNLWSSVELTLALQARLARQRDDDAEAARCRDRMKAAGVLERRFNGNLLDGDGGRRDCVRRAAAERNKTSERDWSLLALTELCFVMELGGSPACPVAALESEFQTILARLRILVDAPASGGKAT